MINKILVLTLIVLISGCELPENYSNNFKEYYYLDNGDSTLHVNCEGGKTYHCWEYYKNSQLKSHVVYDEERLINIVEVYDTSGVELDYGTFDEGSGFVIVYDNDGDLKSSGYFEDGMRNGWWETFNFNGEVINSVFYEDGYVVGENSFVIPNNKY